MYDSLHYLLDNTFIRLGSKLYRKILGIPMGTSYLFFKKREMPVNSLLLVYK